VFGIALALYMQFSKVGSIYLQMAFICVVVACVWSVKVLKKYEKRKERGGRRGMGAGKKTEIVMGEYELTLLPRGHF
jgi:hypothetical protein